MKRGQVSIFIILGLILLLSAGAIVTLYVNSTSEDIEDLTSDALASSVPSDILPFYRFAETCVDTTLDTALRVAGAKGGIIYPEDLDLVYNPTSQTESDGVTLFSSGNFGVAYWNYIYGSNDCEFGCERFMGHIPLEGPKLGSIQSQLELYIERNLPTCIDNAIRLEDIGVYYEERGSPLAEVSIGATDVRVKVDYPLFVSKEDQSVLLPSILGQNDIPLRQYYDDALFITVLLNEYSALEEATIQWISVYSGMDSDKLPPMSGSSSDPATFPFWMLSDVKDDLRSILEKHVPMFTVVNSNNFNPILGDYTEFQALKDQFYKMFEIPAPESFSKYDIFFQYAGREPFLRLNDDDYFLMPESLQMDFFPWFSITRLRTMYDISYPVIISLHNDDLDNYEFSFAYEVNVRNNAPMNTSYVPFDYSQNADMVGDDTYLCDQNQRTSKDVSFTLRNGLTTEPTSDVVMLFHCGDETCALGKTNETGSFDGPLPVCYNSRIDFIKAGYERLSLKVSPNIDYPQQFGDISFEPYRTKNVTVRDVYLDVRTGNMLGVKNLRVGEQAIIQLNRVVADDHPFLIQEDWPAYAMVDYENPTAEMTLLPGKYEGRIIGFVEWPIYIHPDKRCVDIWGGEECYYLPKETMKIDEVPTSGMEYSEAIGYWHASAEDIDASGIIEFRQLFQDIYAIPEQGRRMEDLSAMEPSKQIQIKYAPALRPVFK